MNGFIKRILVYIDGTESSYSAIQYAVCMAKLADAELTGIFVVNTRALNDLVKTNIFLETEQQEYLNDLNSDGERYLKLFRETAAEKEINVEVLQESGAVHQVIKGLVKSEGFDLLVIGELPRIRSRRDESANDAEKAMRYVECPVLIAKNEDMIQEMFEEL